MSLLGLDIGVTGCKAVAFSPAGQTLAEGYREYCLCQPRPGWMELDPAEVWAAVRAVICVVTAAIPSDPVEALAISTHGESVVPLDAGGQPLGFFITAMDTRATEAVRFWEEHLGRERIFAITGMPLHPMYTVNKLMWLRQYQPEAFARARHFVCMADFLFSRFGLPPTMDYSLAARTMAFDPGRLSWSEEILDLAGLDRARLSDIVQAGTVVGEISPAVASELGLPRGTLAVTGGHDQPSGALGCGALGVGTAMDSTGTVECIAVASPKLVLGAHLLANNLPIAPHTVPGMFLVLGWATTAGALLRWFRDNFAQPELAEASRTGASVYDLILAQATEGPSPVLILPHFFGSATPKMDPASKGAILGLDQTTTRGQVIKGMLDSITYEIKLSIDAMEEVGIVVKELRACGGGARSPLWLQTKADILGKPIRAMDVTEVPSLGVAILAGVATGTFKTVLEGAAEMVRPGRTWEPDMARHAQYMERAELFNQIYPTLAELNHQM
jgi:xylulokinase